MWALRYWAKRFFAGVYWPPAVGVPAPPAVPAGGHYLLEIGKKKRKKKQAGAVPFEQRRETARESLISAMALVEDWQDEEDLIALLRFDD